MIGASTPLVLKLITGSNASITQYKEYDRYASANDSLDLGNNNFTIAVAVTKSYILKETGSSFTEYLDDPDFLTL